MKRILLAMALSSATAAFAQSGNVLFSNWDQSSSLGITLNSPVGPNTGSGLVVELFWYNGTSFVLEDTYTSTYTGTGNGYNGPGTFDGGLVTIPQTGTQTFEVEGFYTANGIAYSGTTGPITAVVAAPGQPFLVIDDGGWDGGVVLYPTMPAISNQPVSINTFVGSNATLSVTPVYPNVNYQWQFDGTNIGGATNRSLSFTNIQLTNAGSYDVILSNTNSIITSATAVVSVGPPGAPAIYVNSNLAAIAATVTTGTSITLVSGFTNGFIFYTVDGSPPTAGSTPYAGPFTLTNSATIQAIGYSSDFSQSATMQPLALTVTPPLIITASVSGSGSIGLNPNTNQYAVNTVVTLTATPSNHWSFAQWTGDVSSTNNPLSVTVATNLNIEALFVQSAYPLTLATAGGGTVMANGQSITNATYFPINSTVALTATPSNGWSFAQWTGDVSSTNNPLSVTVTTNLNIEALFVQSAYPLTLTTGGGGTVSANGQSITNTTYFPINSTVALTATPSNGWTFAEWQGGIISTNNPYYLQMTEPYQIVGVFQTVLQTNAVGGGQIVLNRNYPLVYGATAMASAVPNNGNYFLLWSGIASGTNNPVLVTVTDPEIDALFAPLPTNKLSLSVAVLGRGSVIINPQQSYYNYGDQVTLTASWNGSVSSFNGWSGADNDSNSTTVVTVTTNLVVYANFNPLPLTLGLVMGAQGPTLQVSGLQGEYNEIIYSSPDLVNWQPIFTNIPVAGVFQYTDTNTSNLPVRYYRAALQ